VLSSTHDIALHGDLPGVPIPWNALTQFLPSLTKEDVEGLRDEGGCVLPDFQGAPSVASVVGIGAAVVYRP
jgi:hypothetical protein